MEYTTNKNLAKPTENETYDLATVNENMDKIDTALKANDDAISSLTEKMGNVPITTGDEGMKIKSIRRIYVTDKGNVLEIVTNSGYTFYSNLEGKI